MKPSRACATASRALATQRDFLRDMRHDAYALSERADELRARRAAANETVYDTLVRPVYGDVLASPGFEGRETPDR